MSQLIELKQPELATTQKHVNLFIAGKGAVGGSLLSILEEFNHSEFEIQILGICNSKHTKWNNDALKISELINELPCGEETDWFKITNHLIRRNQDNVIFIDATGSREVSEYYGKLLENGVHVTTPSKLANTSDLSYFKRLTDDESVSAEYRFETTVGAGLPVIKTIESLIESGDEITEISGVVSGTMTYLFNQLEQGTHFSESVRSAKENGYSEPDPRDDLSGEDIARKFLILSRIIGLEYDRSDIKVENLVPEGLEQLNYDDFLNELTTFDSTWVEKVESAKSKNQKIRYTGKLTQSGVSIGVEEVGNDSPLGSLKGTDNLIQIFTKRYANSPIIIQGPGAGKEVTAAGILSDILEIAKSVS